MIPSLVRASPCDYCKAPERLCPYCQYGGREVSIGIDGGFRLPTYGVMVGSIGSAVAMWENQEVTQVPVGGLFAVRAKNFTIQNPGGGDWDLALTVVRIPAAGDINTVVNLGTFKNKSSWRSHSGTGAKTSSYQDISDDVVSSASGYKFVMPNENLRLRVRLWGFPFRATGAEFWPPEADW